jgi:hypothetical protein
VGVLDTINRNSQIHARSATREKLSSETLSRKDYADYEFIYGEIKKLLGLSATELISYYQQHPEDRLHWLNRPDGFMFMFTLAGEKRFGQILDRGLKALGDEAHKHDRAKLLQKLKTELVIRAMNGSELTEGNAHNIFESAVTRLSSAHVVLTHYVPCSLVAHRKQTQWTVAQALISVSGQNENETSEIPQRFLDGLAWHSDAISESDLPSRIIKFWTAIERVVTLKNGDPVTQRAALFNSKSKAEYPGKYKAAQSLYSKRSQIVHGTARRSESWYHDAAVESELFSQSVLFNYLNLLDGLGLTALSNTIDARQRLSTWFLQAKAHVERSV